MTQESIIAPRQLGKNGPQVFSHFAGMHAEMSGM